MEYRELLEKLISRRDLREAEASESVGQILEGRWTPPQIAAFLSALATKGEVVSEVAGAAIAMRRKATRIQSLGQTVIDTCGTGGDGSNSFNISTATALVVAGAGVAVAKHGNRSVSSLCGSADVLEKLGVQLTVPPDVMERALNEIGLCFLFAPSYHGAMRYAAPIRKELGVRTLFNMLGPLTNPAAANCQLLGVFKPELTEMFAHVLHRLGTRRAMVVHGHDGLDEISLFAPTRVSELNSGVVKTYDLDPSRWFPEPGDPAELIGGNIDRNAEILLGLLQGNSGACRHVVLLNSAAALVVAGRCDDLSGGIELAAESIDNGSALNKLQALVEQTRSAS